MYDKMYDNANIRQENEEFVKFVRPFLSKDKLVVDLGCGTCRKVIKMAHAVKSVAAVDRNIAMLRQAKKSLKKAGTTNVVLYLGDNLNAPFFSHTFDVCTSALSTWNPAEVHRLLKPDGYFFIETLAPDDKFEVKQAFGNDEFGPRGYLFQQTVEERELYLKTSLEPFFEIEDMQYAKQTTTLFLKGFVQLLMVTPTIRGFSRVKDKGIIDGLTNNGVVSFTEKRIMIRAKAKKI